MFNRSGNVRIKITCGILIAIVVVCFFPITIIFVETTATMQRDTIVFDLINKELERQRHGLELIASENFTSLQVMQAMGGVMTNKYAEGYPRKTLLWWL